MVLETALVAAASVAFAGSSYSQIRLFTMLSGELDDPQNITQTIGKILFTVGSLVGGVLLGTIAVSLTTTIFVPSLLSAGTVSTLLFVGLVTIPASLVCRMLGRGMFEAGRDRSFLEHVFFV